MRKRTNPDSEPNIRRIDTKTRAKKQTHGFQVHFLRGTEVLTKMFSDTIYGGNYVICVPPLADEIRRFTRRPFPDKGGV